MARTTVINERTGEVFPKRSIRGRRDKKFFGWREGDGSTLNAVKNEDYMNYGWPNEERHKSVILQKMRDDEDKLHS